MATTNVDEETPAAAPDPQAGPPESSAPLSGTAAVIAERAAELFASKGFASTSIREIAEASGVTKPMLYYYFGSKEGLIVHIVRSSLRVFQDAVEALAPETLLPDALTEITARQLRFADEHPAVVALLARMDVVAPDEVGGIDIAEERMKHHVLLRSLFERAQAAGEIGPTDPTLLAMSFAGALIVQIMARIQVPHLITLGPAQAATAMVELFLDGARHRSAPARSAEAPEEP